MQDLELFYNDGTGWFCKQCERELGLEKELEHAHARFFREGEAESKFPTFSDQARAKWLDRVAEVLICPRCGVTEKVDKY